MVRLSVRRAALVLAAVLAWARGVLAQGRLSLLSRAVTRGAVATFVAALTPGLVLAQGATDDSLFSGSVGSGARALAIGGAFVAVADDATAASWNPAGLCVLERPEASVVGQPLTRSRTNYAASTFRSGVSSTSTLDRRDPYSINARGANLDFASITYPIRLGSLKLVPQLNYQKAVASALDYDLSYGYRLSTVGGGAVSQPNRQYTYDAAVGGGLDLYGASLGIGIIPQLYLGVSVNRLKNEWHRDGVGRTDFSPASSTQTARSDFTSVTDETFEATTFHVGVLLKPANAVRLGAVYKSGFSTQYTFRYQSQNTSVTGSGAVRPLAPSDFEDSGTLEYPWTAAAGIALLPTDDLTLSVDFTTTKWSEAGLGDLVQANYARGTTFQIGRVGWPNRFCRDCPESAENPYQADSRQIRFGGEYVAKTPGFAGLTAVPLRIGAFLDRQFFKNRPDLGPVDFTGVTSGLGLVWKRLTLDLAYVFVTGEFRCCEETVGAATLVEEGNDKFTSHRVFVSSTVRF